MDVGEGSDQNYDLNSLDTSDQNYDLNSLDTSEWATIGCLLEEFAHIYTVLQIILTTVSIGTGPNET